MFARSRLARLAAFTAVTSLGTAALAGISLTPAAAATRTAAAMSGAVTTAWHDGRFAEDTAGVVSRSGIVLGQPNSQPAQYMPLGNGRLAAAVWAAGGFTAQLNRTDTFPGRKSPGQVVIPGLAKMTAAPDFTGRLDLYNGVLSESGGGMTVQARVLANSDELVVDVTGADPGTTQTASVNLWSGRTPSAQASGGVGTLSETWPDNVPVTGSGETFGTLAAITAGGRDVQASVASPLSVQVSFRPNLNGSFRIVVAAPHWAGGNAMATAERLLGRDAARGEAALTAAHLAWWHNFWASSGLIEMNSADGSAQYLENVRTIYLYTEAASSRSALPGSQAGVADMFNFSRDHADWYPAAYWFWNLRMQVAANISSGNFALNLPVFNLYLSNLSNLEAWTREYMGGRPGICVPETMRYNGNGFQNDGTPFSDASCDENIPPTWNGQTVTTGTEISLWIWQQYQDTGDRTFLRKYYPLMSESAQFLLAYAAQGADGLLHTVANAHENQWDVQDPTTDIAAMQALFPAVTAAAGLLNTDASLVAQLRAAETELPPFARTDEATHTQLLTPAADATGTDVIGDSYQPTAAIHNSENTGLETVWPYNVIGDGTVRGGDNLTALAGRTYDHRPNVNTPDWNFDAVDAARLDLASQVQSDLIASTEKYQAYPSGMGAWQGGVGDEPYIEQSGVLTTALDEALATDYDGTLRIAPAWPAGWDVSGTVYVQDATKVDVQVENGTPVTAAIEAGATHSMLIRNPWPGQQAQVVDGRSRAIVLAPTTASTFTLNVRAGRSYLVEQVSDPTTALPFAQVTGAAATSARHLGGVRIGLDPAAHYSSLAASYDNAGVSDDTATAPGNFDGNGASFSAQALAAAGASPGAAITSSGVTFTWPSAAAGADDNTAAGGQFISLNAAGSDLGFLISGSWGPVTGTGEIVYTDGTIQSYSLTAPDWQALTPPNGGAVAISSAYQNRPGNTQYGHPADIYSVAVPLQAGKTVTEIQLPGVSAGVTNGQGALHVFSLAISP
ncbi:MAG: trimeric autotransporter adhesin [Streptosporangiaceae bacterium]|nr:trimeric autotransporter adhesin [Streptosporangiaceae bacterium]